VDAAARRGRVRPASDPPATRPYLHLALASATGASSPLLNIPRPAGDPAMVNAVTLAAALLIGALFIAELGVGPHPRDWRLRRPHRHLP
jgi:hypothetical protein